FKRLVCQREPSHETSPSSERLWLRTRRSSAPTALRRRWTIGRLQRPQQNLLLLFIRGTSFKTAANREPGHPSESRQTSCTSNIATCSECASLAHRSGSRHHGPGALRSQFFKSLNLERDELSRGPQVRRYGDDLWPV